MSIDVYHATAVVGCKILKDKVFYHVRECGCDLAADFKGSLCLECGNDAWGPEQIRPDLDSHIDGEINEDFSDDATIGGAEITIIECSDFMLVGETIKVGYHDEDESRVSVKSIMTNTSEIRKQVKAALEPAGLWDAKEFGVWLTVSD